MTTIHDTQPTEQHPMAAPHLHVILGSTRQGRFGDRVADWFMRRSSSRTDITAELVDLRDWPLPFFDQPTPPMMGNYTGTAQQRWAAKVAEADGYIFITPEYNHGYPAVLKNAIDHLYGEWKDKPVGFVGYGGPGGGIRAVEQLRQVVIELQMVPMRSQVAVASVYRAFGSDDLTDPALDSEADAVLTEIARWATTLKAAQQQQWSAVNGDVLGESSGSGGDQIGGIG